MSQELYEEIARLTIENERIKKTSKQRFDKNKKLNSDMVYLQNQSDKLENIKSFLNSEGFKIEAYRGLPAVHYSVFSAIQSLRNKAKKMEKPEVDGTYSMKVDGKWLTTKVRNSLCWQLFDEEMNSFHGIHFYNISEFILLEADK